MLTRRELLRAGGALALGGLLAACKRDGPPRPAAGATLDDVIAQRQQTLRMRWTSNDVLARANDRFTFVLEDAANATPVRAATGDVWIAEGLRSEARGPFPFRPLQGLEERGVYIAHVSPTKEGRWLAVAETSIQGRDRVGGAEFTVGPQSVQPKPGDTAVSVPTPTADDHRGVEPYCTAKPPCSLHQVSLERALTSGKPTIMIIATPAFCTSELCGPEVEYVEEVAREIGSKANFVHIEVYKDDDPATIRRAALAPAAAAWRLQVEPAVYFIGSDAVIRDRTLGPTDVVEIRNAARALVR